MANKSKSLVLVVGAGASKEVGLPIGADLRSEIASLLNIQFPDGYTQRSGDRLITETFRALAQTTAPIGDINPFLTASWAIRDAVFQAASIDNFIDAHRGNKLIELCGKLAIARTILAAEANSKMHVDPSNIYNKMNFKELEATWYCPFFRMIVDNCQLEAIPERLQSIAIITFNYDRCIENYLHASLVNYYGIPVDKATDLIGNLRIFHPYGFIGDLPWRSGQPSVAFGQEVGRDNLLKISHRLKTFTEGTDETHSDIIELRATMKSATRIAFLGFAYHRQNLELLFGRKTGPTSPKMTFVGGTAKDISESDCSVIGNELRNRAGYIPSILPLRRDLTCCQFMHEYSRTLAFH